MKNSFADKTGLPSEQELEQINKLTRKNLSADEVYTFSVVLCDNEIDRDFERFSLDALYTLSELYVGKTGIFDHSMRGRDQVARIYSCKVEQVPSVTTKDGKPYHQLKSGAYIPRTPKNNELILELDAGIKKEVSVGCAVSKALCSICGTDKRTQNCSHQKGRVYGKDKRLCFISLESPTDAYEWSFVAVPAQPKAGVVKSFSRIKEDSMDTQDILKSLHSGGDVTLSAQQVQKLCSYITALDEQAEQGRVYTDELRGKVLKLYAVKQPEISCEVLKQVISKMTAFELKAFSDAAEKSAAKDSGLCPQLNTEEKTKKSSSVGEFII